MPKKHCPYCNTLVGVTQTKPPRPIAQPPSDDVMRMGVPTPKQHPHCAAVDFYYLSGLAVVGPLTGIELREAAFANKVVSETLVTNDASGPWVAANLVKGLFDIHGRPLPHPPDALRQIEQAQADEAAATRPEAFQSFLDTTKSSVTGVAQRIASPAKEDQTTDSWGIVGSVAGGISAGLLLVGLCFTPFACCAVPISIGGIVAALFSKNQRLRLIGLIGNSFVLFLSLAIVVWLSLSFAMALNGLQDM